MLSERISKPKDQPMKGGGKPVTGRVKTATSPGWFTPKGVLRLQRTLGNRAVARLSEARLSDMPARRPSAPERNWREVLIQRAGPYQGLLPEHDTYGDKYKFQGVDSDKFTYHHIIPENKLHEALPKLKAILEAEGESDERSRLKAGVEKLKGAAREQWINTRARNTTYAINKEYSDYGVVVTEGQLKPLIADNTTLDPLFKTVKDLVVEQLRTKLKYKFLRAKSDFRDALSEQLKEPESTWVGAVQGLVDANKLENYPVVDPQAVVAAINSAPQPRKGSRKGNIMRAVDVYVNGVTFDEYSTGKHPELHADSVAMPAYLKRIVRDSGMPKQGQDELEDSVTWMPGNIHRGPESKTRLSPKAGKDFDHLVDDGGDSFETAAANLVETPHFQRLIALDGKLGRIIAIDDGKLITAENITLAADTVEDMLAIQQFGLTQYDKENWREKTVGGKQQMRLERNDQRLRAAGLIE